MLELKIEVKVFLIQMEQAACGEGHFERAAAIANLVTC